MNKPLLVVTELYMPTKGGTAVWFDEVYRRIGGKEIHVVTADVPGADEYDKEHDNSVHRVSLRRHPWLRPESLFMYLKLLFRCLRVGIANRIGAVHAGRVLPEGLVGLITARLLGKPLVIYAHGEEITSWKNPKKIKVMRYTYRHADRIVANSEFTKEALLALGVPEHKIAIISPGVNVQRFRPGLVTTDLRKSIGLADAQKLVLSVGRLSRRKGFDQMVKALADSELTGADLHYALIGIGEDREYLENLAQDLGVAQRVHFLGHVSTEDLPRWYNACDFFAMPNREIEGDTEGFGMVFLEAAACGKPVIAGRAGGTGAAVEEGVTGFRVDGTELTELVSAMKTLIFDIERAKQYAKNAYDRAIQEFSWEQVAIKTKKL